MTDGDSCTLVQLNDLYRGLVSSSKKLIFNPKRDLKTLGVGKKFSKKDVEGMLFGMQSQHIITELGTRNKMGFMVTKVHSGENGPSLEHNLISFEVEVSKKAKGGGATKAKASPKKKATKKKKAKEKGREVIELVDSDDDFEDALMEVDNGNDDDAGAAVSHAVTKRTSRKDNPHGLTSKHVKELEIYLRNKSKVWASEINDAKQAGEQDIRYWTIISQQQCKIIAAAAPLNKAEFVECSTMGVHKGRKWGQKIVAAVKDFYIENDLWGSVPSKRKVQEAWSPEVPPSQTPSSKRSRTSSSNPTNLAVRLSMSQENADPYADSGIDWDHIAAPTTTTTTTTTTRGASVAATDSLQLTQTFKFHHFGGGNNPNTPSRDTPSPALLPPKKVKNPYMSGQNKLTKYRMEVRSR